MSYKQTVIIVLSLTGRVKELESSSSSNARLSRSRSSSRKDISKTGAARSGASCLFGAARASSERSDPVCRAHGSQRPDNFGLSGLPVLLRPLSTIILEVASEFNLWIRGASLSPERGSQQAGRSLSVYHGRPGGRWGIRDEAP